jgi:PmbA protein
MARVVPEDPYAGLAEEARYVDGGPLDLYDGTEPPAETLIERAAVAEDAALSVRGVTNSEGAEAGFGLAEIVLVTSAGFSARFQRSSHSISVTALAGSGTGMQRDYDYSSAVHLSDLEEAAGLGHAAGEKAVARLNPTRPATKKMPVVFDPRVASSLIGHLAGAINGASVARGTTFLRDKLGQRIFAPGIDIVDDPLRVRGLRSRPFDGEGVPTAPCLLVEDGVLTTWLLDTRSARQLGLKTTGHAQRGVGGPPGPGTSNLYLRPGALTPAELMSDIVEGIYVTELIGMGVNGMTGDYSRGAAGFMIRGGALAEPVAEITIAGTLQEMFAHMIPANDLRFRRGVDAPTIRVEGLTVAGA